MTRPRGRGKASAAKALAKPPRRPRAVKNEANKVLRKEARRKLGTLARNLVLPPTLRRYEVCCTIFFRWLVAAMVRLPAGADGMDEVLCQYVEQSWQEGDSQSTVRFTLAGMEFFVRGVRGRLNGAWALMKAWKLKELPSRAPPLIELHLHAIAGWLLQAGEMRLAIACYFAYHSIVRMAEMFTLTNANVSFGDDGEWASCHLGITKGSARRGTTDTAYVDVPWLTTALRLLTKMGQSGDLLFGTSAPRFRKRFGQAIAALGLESKGLAAYSLKRGGATSMFRACGQYDKVCERGHWGNVRTARIYINDGLAMLAQMESTAAELERLQPFVTTARQALQCEPLWKPT